MAAVCGYDGVDHHIVALTHRRTEQMLSARGRCSTIPAARLSCPEWSACSARLPASASGRKAATIAACSRGAARRSRCGRGSNHRIEVPAATDTAVERRRKHNAHSGAEFAEREGFEPQHLSNFSSHPGTTSIPPRVPGAFNRALEPIRRRQRRLSGFQGAQNRVSGEPMIQSAPSERRYLGRPHL